MLRRIDDLINGGDDFAFETTLSTKSYVSLAKDARANGYTIILIFFWLDSIELAKQRVKSRVASGGHNIPSEVIERRYFRGLENLFKFIELSDNWTICNNSTEPTSIIATGNREMDFKIHNHDIWEIIKKYDKGRV